MPQMSPLKWLILFIFFSLSYLLFSSIMYFNIIPTQSTSSSIINIKTPNLNWKW
uniref:ATP synthase complex subunit 8 n=1 Tax=Ctenolepisma villosum TaxID=257043 RepID=A0A6C0UBC4_9INSE|nr:ATP synthase F0 subunit 8 [Ctenolepisma villosum]QIB71363.1 ATP synthase F0 subunit 8 [Ctenolepisma villosum]